MARRSIFLDWDGITGGEQAYVVMSYPTGVLYHQQYGGTACRHAEIEGYLVPVDGARAVEVLREVFEGDLEGAGTSRPGSEWPAGLFERVVAAVESVRFWPAEDEMPVGGRIGSASLRPLEDLRFDRSREDDVDEAWIPVMTSDGPGVFVWNNSD